MYVEISKQTATQMIVHHSVSFMTEVYARSFVILKLIHFTATQMIVHHPIKFTLILNPLKGPMFNK